MFGEGGGWRGSDCRIVVFLVNLVADLAMSVLDLDCVGLGGGAVSWGGVQFCSVDSGGGGVDVAPMIVMLWSSFVCRIPVGRRLSSQSGVGLAFRRFWDGEFTDEDCLLQGCLVFLVDGGGGWPSSLDCIGFHCCRLVLAAGLYIWERPDRLNGEAGLRWFVRQWLPGS
ncbi:hypothetical protein RHMOL_Rhmol02G0165300 [Rhododendron molle]|uniref:Uncharacterized protein n=1 Tax=Rhododendron molle TaxID=49168 RepID=A0ACC0PS82_RHOML|nr:hypothetical protein RHMOL_Rhmol02G0165300 [Rhododendron molle]